MNNPLMKCGHTAQAVIYGTETPVCAICGCTDIEDAIPDLTGRKAHCSEHRGTGGITDSSFNLAFFKHCPDKDFDEFYCGCWGWN